MLEWMQLAMNRERQLMDADGCNHEVDDQQAMVMFLKANPEYIALGYESLVVGAIPNRWDLSCEGQTCNQQKGSGS